MAQAGVLPTIVEVSAEASGNGVLVQEGWRSLSVQSGQKLSGLPRDY
jgi:hypothetical protein